MFDAPKASYEVTHLDQAIIKLTMTNIRSVMGGMDLDQMLSHRDEINKRLLRVVDAAVSPWGIKVNRIEIKDIVPPADLVQSMGRQMKAEREKRAEILQAEGLRQSAILKAEGQKQSQILEAEGRKEAWRSGTPRRASVSAQAEAKATEVVSAAIANGDVTAINYFVADKYMKVLAELADSPNQKTLIMPLEVTGAARLARRHRRDRQGDVRPRRPDAVHDTRARHPCRGVPPFRRPPPEGGEPWVTAARCSRRLRLLVHGAGSSRACSSLDWSSRCRAHS